jgi:hypothetical protein
MTADRSRVRRIQQIATRLGRIAVALVLVLAASAPVCAQEAGANANPIAVEPISFKPSASSAIVSGSVASPDRKVYSVVARAQQTLTVGVTSAEDNAVFQIYKPPATPERRDYGIAVVGKALEGAADEQDAKHWSGRLPVSGQYLVVVGPTRGNADYRLTVVIR